MTAHSASLLRLSLCCRFGREPVKFPRTTGTALPKLEPAKPFRRLSKRCSANADALLASLLYCSAHGIGPFRSNSQILPIRTHPDAGYDVNDLPDAARIGLTFRDRSVFARAGKLRLSIHPDPFVVLNSPNPVTLKRSLAALDYQAEVANWAGADSINAHGGPSYGDKLDGLRALARNIEPLPVPVRLLPTLENDDKVFTLRDLLPVREATKTPLVHDVHHHRCLDGRLSVEEATRRAIATWRAREPLFHVLSPLEGWDGPKLERHHDSVVPSDFPTEWIGRALTVEVEARAKELAVLKPFSRLRAAN